MEIKDKTDLGGAKLAARKVYLPPALREFGAVGALTQGGTAGPSENNVMCDMQKPAEIC